jgi:hypothetical protein
MFFGVVQNFVSEILRQVETAQIGGAALNLNGLGHLTLFSWGLGERESRERHERAPVSKANVDPAPVGPGSPR